MLSLQSMCYHSNPASDFLFVCLILGLLLFFCSAVEPPLKKIKLKVKGLSKGISTSLSMSDEAVAEEEVVEPEPVTQVKQKAKGWKGWVILGEGEEKATPKDGVSGEANCPDHDGIGSTTERRSLRNKRKRA